MNKSKKEWLEGKKDSLTLLVCIAVFGLSVTICAIMAAILINSEPRGYGDINGWVQALASLVSLVISAITILFIFYTFKSSKDALIEQRKINSEQVRYNQESLRISGAAARPWPLVGKVTAVNDVIRAYGDEIENIKLSFNIKNYSAIPCIETQLCVCVLPVGLINNFDKIEESISEVTPPRTVFPGTIGPNEEYSAIINAFVDFVPYVAEDTDRIETMNYKAAPFIILYSLRFINPVDLQEVIDEGELMMSYGEDRIYVTTLNEHDIDNLKHCYP